MVTSPYITATHRQVGQAYGHCGIYHTCTRRCETGGPGLWSPGRIPQLHTRETAKKDHIAHIDRRQLARPIVRRLHITATHKEKSGSGVLNTHEQKKGRTGLFYINRDRQSRSIVARPCITTTHIKIDK